MDKKESEIVTEQMMNEPTVLMYHKDNILSWLVYQEWYSEYITITSFLN